MGKKQLEDIGNEKKLHITSLQRTKRLLKEKKLGRYLVEQKLFQHGIDFSIMDSIISNLYKKVY